MSVSQSLAEVTLTIVRDDGESRETVTVHVPRIAIASNGLTVEQDTEVIEAMSRDVLLHTVFGALQIAVEGHPLADEHHQTYTVTRTVTDSITPTT